MVRRKLRGEKPQQLWHGVVSDSLLSERAKNLGHRRIGHLCVYTNQPIIKA
eukprot:COSAG05_NODE_317_length_11545_cov_73.981391_6_plen_51_part_00